MLFGLSRQRHLCQTWPLPARQLDPNQCTPCPLPLFCWTLKVIRIQTAEDAMPDKKIEIVSALKLCAIGFAVVILLGAVNLSTASADEANAKSLLKAMSDYMAAQKTISFDYDANLEVVSKENQKVGLASSGKLMLNRPDKVHGTRTGGFADVEFAFDGKTLTLLGKNANVYAQVEA